MVLAPVRTKVSALTLGGRGPVFIFIAVQVGQQGSEAQGISAELSLSPGSLYSLQVTGALLARAQL